ncbi:MAG: MBL fold metallo-hydrolase [Clostridia bacterium]|nr:MBL fold metallo-hydrolase [Clostridia bacterium]
MKVIDNEFIEVHKLELEIENTGHITNCYVVKDKETAKVSVIDPAFDDEKIKQVITEINGNLDIVVLTHCHADHIAALAKLVENTDVKVYVHTKDYDGLYNKQLNAEDIVQTKVLPVDRTKVFTVQDKDIIKLGNTTFEVIHTPGHTEGSITLFDEKNNILYSGDTIFENSYGRTDLVNGSHDEMKDSLNKILDRFEDIQVFSGHGEDFNLKNSKRKIRLLFAYKG